MTVMDLFKTGVTLRACLSGRQGVEGSSYFPTLVGQVLRLNNHLYQINVRPRWQLACRGGKSK